MDCVKKAFNFSADTKEEMLATMPPYENGEMVRGTSSAPSDNEDKVSFKTLKQEWTALQSDDNFSGDATF